MDSLYSKYLKETEEISCIENEFGFATYQMNLEQKFCYIINLYVVPNKRNLDYASKFADEISREAYESGCIKLIGSVDLAFKDPDTSIKVLHGYGMKISSINGNKIFFEKEIMR